MVIERPIHGFSGWDSEGRKKPLSRGAVITIAAVAGLHLAGAAYLYTQRIAPAQIATPSDPPTIIVDPVRIRHDEPKPMPPVKTPPRDRPKPEQVHDTPRTATTPPDSPLPATPHPATPVDQGPPRLVDTVTPTPTPAPPGPKTIRNPTWLARPTADQLAIFYPPDALDRGVSGSATLDCLVTATGQLTQCTVSGETPPREGFGAAALKASRIFRMSPRTEDGQPVEGGLVHIPMHFVQ